MRPEARRERPVRGVLWSLAAAVLAAGYLIPYKAGAGHAGAEALALPMLLAAAGLNTLALGLPWAGRPWRWPRLDRLTLLVALILGACSALGNEAMAQALVHVEPGLASVVLRSQVVLVGLGGLWLLAERVGWRFWAGAGIALAGFALQRLPVADAGDSTLIGLLWVLLAAAGFAVMQLAVRKTAQRIDLLAVNGLRLWLAAALLLLLPGRLGGLLRLDGETWLLAAAAGLFGPVGSRLCLMAALRHIPAALSTLVLFVSPLFAYLAAGIAFGVWPGGWELLGSGLILAGVALPVLERLGRTQRLRAGAGSE